MAKSTRNSTARTLNIKKGDQVRVVAGNDKGAEGKVIRTIPSQSRVVVEGVNRVKRHTRSQQQGGNATTGGIITTEAPIDVSNVMLLVEVEGEKVVTRIGFRRDEVTKTRPDGSTYTAERSVRVARRTGKEI